MNFHKKKSSIPENTPDRPVIALAGNPNVGKSTLFNNLTSGKKQHTGNWIGKTTANAWGICSGIAKDYVLVDIPGTYSLSSRSAEETVARDFICFGAHQAVVIVCDATCLERNLNLVLQILEATDRVLVCVNLLDEAEKTDIVASLFILILQIYGRLARVTNFSYQPPNIYFADGAWRPSEANPDGFNCLQELLHYLDQLMQDPLHAEIAHSLYYPFFTAFKKGVEHV